MIYKTRYLTLSAIMVLLGSMVHFLDAQTTVKLAWNANPEPEIAGYILHVGEGNEEFNLVLDVGNVTTHELLGLKAGKTYFFSLQAYTADEQSALSPAIEHTTHPAGEYGAWANNASLNGKDALALGVPMKDGVPNLLKYAFNMNPRTPDNRVLVKDTGTAGLPLYTLDTSTASPVFRVEFLRRRDGSVRYEPKISTDLVNYLPMSGDVQITPVDTAWERVVIRHHVDPVLKRRMFGRVEVTLP